MASDSRIVEGPRPLCGFRGGLGFRVSGLGLSMLRVWSCVGVYVRFGVDFPERAIWVQRQRVLQTCRPRIAQAEHGQGKQ